MSYLKTFPVDRLKVDQSFVSSLPAGEKDEAILRAIVSLGHNLGLKVCAEGVETGAQQSLLRDIGCDEAQGYFFSMPVSPEEFGQLL